MAQTGDLAGAEAALETFLTLEGRSGAAYLDLGNLWRSFGENERAMAAFRAAIRQAPDCAEAYQNLGALLMLQGQFALAARCCQKTLALQPDALGALSNWGECQLAQGQYAAALETYERALTQAPDCLNILYAYEYLRLRLCDWQDYSARVAALEARLVSYWQDPANPRLLPLVINSFGFPMALHRLQARHWSQGIAQNNLSRRRWDLTNLPPWNGKLKLGYVSADFRVHAVGTLIQDLFQYHDRSRIEVYAYSLADTADEITEKIRGQCDHWVNLAPLSSRAAADRIQADGIHILIDLAGYTALSRSDILALQPAPLQIAYLGYPDTTGAEFIQYILADRRLIPPELEPYYTETLLPLSHSFVTSAWEIPPPTLTRRDLGLPDSAVVFACFNRSDKFDPESFAIWMEILTAVPGAVLWFMEEVSETQANLRAEAARLGLDPQRLIFTPKLPWADFVGVCSLADLFLDTPRYNAGATALCALRAGLPVLTCPGQSYASRMGASINAAAGLEDLICRDLEEYRDQAIALARNPQGLQAVKQRLAQTTQLPLFQPQPWIQELETRLLELWRDYPALLV